MSERVESEVRDVAYLLRSPINPKRQVYAGKSLDEAQARRDVYDASSGPLRRALHPSIVRVTRTTTITVTEESVDAH